MECKCKNKAPLFTVKKEGINKGKRFYTCSNKLNSCGFFQWENEIGYDPKRYKPNSCKRCGRYECLGAKETDKKLIDLVCDRKYDWFGMTIPDNWKTISK